MSLEDTIRGLTDAVTALNETLRANREALLSIPTPTPEKAAPAPKQPKRAQGRDAIYNRGGTFTSARHDDPDRWVV
jgi:hypothetical protein